jgi:putative Mg2+ transporter-C (MgtC) family protein
MEVGSFAPVSLSWADVLLRVGASLIFALSIGVERLVHRKPVDFRPFVIIAVASCTLCMAILELAEGRFDPAISVDPAKVVSGVMTGIGFLGAGALFREHHYVRGAGSAAAVWAAGAIGIVCGLGFVWLGGILATVVMLSLLVGRRFVSDYTAEVEDHGDDRP